LVRGHPRTLFVKVAQRSIAIVAITPIVKI
jgi:hypothetical protein